MKSIYILTIISIITLTIAKSSGACNPDASTSRPAQLPGSVQSAINSLNAQLGGIPLKLGKTNVAASISISPNVTITEQDCGDEKNCLCGLYGTGSGSFGSTVSLSADIGSMEFGPLHASAFGYDLSVSSSATLSASGSGTTVSNTSFSRGCSAADYTWSCTGSQSTTLSISGTGTGSAKITKQEDDGTTTDIATAEVSAAGGGNGIYNATFTLSNTGSSIGITTTGYSASLTANVQNYGSVGFEVTL